MVFLKSIYMRVMEKVLRKTIHNYPLSASMAFSAIPK